MRTDKLARAMAEYDGHAGAATVGHVLSTIPESMQHDLTGRQVGKVMSIRNAAYHEGRASLGGLDLCDDCVWLPWGGDDGKGQLVPIAALAAIKIEETRVDRIADAHGVQTPSRLCHADGTALTDPEAQLARQTNNKGVYYLTTDHTRRYTMSHSESYIGL